MKPIPPLCEEETGSCDSTDRYAVRDIIQICKDAIRVFRSSSIRHWCRGEGAAESVAKALPCWMRMVLMRLSPGVAVSSIEISGHLMKKKRQERSFLQYPGDPAVGHETDTTIADYVAGFACSDAIGAAELAVADISALQGELYRQKSRLFEATTRKVQDKRDELARREKTLSLLRSAAEKLPGSENASCKGTGRSGGHAAEACVVQTGDGV